jgi:hypothetical protein
VAVVALRAGRGAEEDHAVGLDGDASTVHVSVDQQLDSQINNSICGAKVTRQCHDNAMVYWSILTTRASYNQSRCKAEVTRHDNAMVYWSILITHVSYNQSRCKAEVTRHDNAMEHGVLVYPNHTRKLQIDLAAEPRHARAAARARIGGDDDS